MMLESADSEHTRLTVKSLFSKNSKPMRSRQAYLTSRTDGQTTSTCHSNTALYVYSFTRLILAIRIWSVNHDRNTQFVEFSSRYNRLAFDIPIAWPPRLPGNQVPTAYRDYVHSTCCSHGLHVDYNVSDDGFRVCNIYVDDLISTASPVANRS